MVGGHGVSGLIVTSVIVKLVILCLEVIEKRNLILSKWKDQSPAATSGVLNNSMYLWLSSLLYQGYSSKLNVDNLMTLDKEITDASRPTALLEKWKLGKLLATPCIPIHTHHFQRTSLARMLSSGLSCGTTNGACLAALSLASCTPVSCSLSHIFLSEFSTLLLNPRDSTAKEWHIR